MPNALALSLRTGLGSLETEAHTRLSWSKKWTDHTTRPTWARRLRPRIHAAPPPLQAATKR
jgi:hypothetical protein